MLLTLWSNRQVFLLSHQNGGSLMLKLQNFSLFLIINNLPLLTTTIGVEYFVEFLKSIFS